MQIDGYLSTYYYANVVTRSHIKEDYLIMNICYGCGIPWAYSFCATSETLS